MDYSTRNRKFLTQWEIEGRNLFEIVNQALTQWEEKKTYNVGFILI